MLLAGGAVLLEEALSGPWGYFARAFLSVAIAAMALVFVPIVSPLGSIEWKERYIARVLGFMLDDPSDLTFDFRNQLYRTEEIQALLAVYTGLTPEERRDCAILTYEYDGASAVNVLGPAIGLPRGISGNNSYYLWGPGDASGNCIIALDYDEKFLKQFFREVSVATKAPDRSGKLGNAGRPVFLCRGPVAPLRELWPEFKTFH